MHHADHHAPDPDKTPAEVWEERYAQADRVWSGRPNQAVVDVVGPLPAGRALDLGCGEGADAVWLAGRGWQVTGVDISPTAVARASAAAAARGLEVAFRAADLATWQPERTYDLVTAAFLQSHVALERVAVLRRAAGAVAPGGHLLVVTHAAPPPWAAALEGGDFPGPREQVAELALGEGWQAVLAEVRRRPATGPDGTEAELEDAVVLLRRDAGLAT